MNLPQCLEHARIRVEVVDVGDGLQGKLDGFAAERQKCVNGGLLLILVGIKMRNERPGQKDGGMVVTQLQQRGLTTE